jgi:tRNA pseudouridine55 synthase
MTVNADWEGLLLTDKPEGPTSHDIVSLVRRSTGQRRIGHSGTLDPMASGLLPLMLGRATRLVRFLFHSPKDYTGSLQLGLRSDSDDITGGITRRHDGPLPDPDAVKSAAAGLVGRLMQLPPAISARKVGGERLYKLARRGVEVRPAATEVEVELFELEAAGQPGLYRFEARVSGGTYIRSMVRDLGETLGCGGVLASLRRTAIGPMRPTTDPALDPEALRDALVPLEAIPLALSDFRLDEEQDARSFSQGGRPAVPRATGAAGLCRVLSPAGMLLGVGELLEGQLRPKVVLPPAP